VSALTTSAARILTPLPWILKWCESGVYLLFPGLGPVVVRLIFVKKILCIIIWNKKNLIMDVAAIYWWCTPTISPTLFKCCLLLLKKLCSRLAGFIDVSSTYVNCESRFRWDLQANIIFAIWRKALCYWYRVWKIISGRNPHIWNFEIGSKRAGVAEILPIFAYRYQIMSVILPSCCWNKFGIPIQFVFHAFQKSIVPLDPYRQVIDITIAVLSDKLTGR